ncbi:protein phosphatase 2C domain-containing protein [Streptomyces liangshanensis]|uniref:protein phosphatase 2C domain-containing protein n=1 Tax=Streptomyces liangshanensis TaxID=2717324 RepID=UPI0036D9704D
MPDASEFAPPAAGPAPTAGPPAPPAGGPRPSGPRAVPAAPEGPRALPDGPEFAPPAAGPAPTAGPPAPPAGGRRPLGPRAAPAAPEGPPTLPDGPEFAPPVVGGTPAPPRPRGIPAAHGNDPRVGDRPHAPGRAVGWGDGGADAGSVMARAAAGRDSAEEFPGAGRPGVAYLGGGPPTYDPDPTALPPAHPDRLGELVADTVLDGARYGTYTLRAASVRGDSARYRGEPRRDTLLTARFGEGDSALILVAVATGVRATEGAHLAAADACHWIGGAVGRSHARLSDDIRAGRRGDLKAGLQRLTDRGYGKLRARAAELDLPPDAYTASLRCLLLPADPACRTRVFFGVGGGGLLRLRDGAWQDLEPDVPDPAALTGDPVVGFGSRPAETPRGERLTMDLGIPTPPAPYVEKPVPPQAEPFRFRASVAKPGDTLLLCSPGLAEPLRGVPALAAELAERWASAEPPGLASYLADTQLRVKGYADDRTAVAVWEA